MNTSCGCNNCKKALKQTAQWTEIKKIPPYMRIRTNIKVGDRVLVHGKHTGLVRYVGDLDSYYGNGEIYVGIKMDDPVGDCDGLHSGKRFFKCPQNHGLIVPLTQVAYIPIPGKKKRVEEPSADPLTAKECFELKLMKQIKKLLPSSATGDTESLQPAFSDEILGKLKTVMHQSIDTVSRKLSDEGGVAPISKKATSQLPLTPNNTPNELTPFNSSSLTGSQAKGTTVLDFDLVSATIDNNSNGAATQEGVRKPKDYVSTWMDCIQSIRKCPFSPKLFINCPIVKVAGNDSNISCSSSSRCDDTETVESAIKHKTSFTSRLLSGLPKEDVLSPNSKLKDVEEFRYWMEQWGGGLKGWRMARARQQLKHAQRLGKKQTKWQQTIDRLGKDALFRPQVKRIDSLHTKLMKIRSTYQDIEKETQILGSSTRYKKPSDKKMAQLVKQIQEEEERIKQLEQSIESNPIAGKIAVAKLMTMKA